MSETTEYSGAVVPAQSAAMARGIRIETMADAMQIAKTVIASGLAPRGLDKPEAIMIAMQHGQELGLMPLQSLQSIGVINGRPGIYGDAAMALVRASGLLVRYSQRYEGEGDKRACIVSAERAGGDVIEQSFSVADAKRAGLWGKGGPWTTSPDRMLMFRARGFLLRDLFADVLRGLVTFEELRDMPKDEPAKKEAPRCDLLASPSARVVEAETVEPVEEETPSQIIATAWGAEESTVSVWLESKGKNINAEQARRVAGSEKYKAEFLAWDAAEVIADATAEGGAV